MSKQIMVAGVVLLAIFVQLSFVPNHILKFDSSQVLYAANKLALNGDFPVYGILNSRRALNPPFFVWLYLVPIMLVKDPSWVLILPALTLHVIALILLYCLGRRHFGLKVGLAAAVLYGFSTRGLYLGHASWAQAFLSPLYVLVMFSLFQWLQEGKARHLALLLPLAAWTTGVHWGGALTLGVLLLLPLLCSSPRFQTSPILAGGLIALALWIPYLNFEKDRAFADMRALVQGSLPVPSPGDVSRFCHDEEDSRDREEGSIDTERLVPRLKQTMRSKWPVGYEILKKGFFACSGIIRALTVNFHWSPFKSRVAGSLKQQALYFIEVVVFLLGLGILVFRTWVRQTATSAERLLLFTFLVPVLLQNITPHNTLRRPDVSWLFYGPQVLIVAYTFTAHRLVQSRVMQGLIVAGLSLLIVVECHGAATRVSSTFGGVSNYQRQMVSWIAEDVLRQGRQGTAIRYDFLQDIPEWCWIVSCSALKDTYYVGAQYDYLLEHLHGIENTGKVPDGWAANPDYIVLFAKGLSRYDLHNGKYDERKFGGYVVLKVLK